MKRRVLGIVAIGCGCLCALAVFSYTGQIEGKYRAQRDEALGRFGGEQTRVLVATRDIAPGEALDERNAEERTWLVDLLPAGAVSQRDDLQGKKASTPILKGEVVTDRRFAAEESLIHVPEHRQAIALELDRARAVGGALTAESRVDVYAAGASGASLICADCAVVAVSEASSRVDVTLAVPQEKVAELILATQRTEVYLVLPG